MEVRELGHWVKKMQSLHRREMPTPYAAPGCRDQNLVRRRSRPQTAARIRQPVSARALVFSSPPRGCRRLHGTFTQHTMVHDAQDKESVSSFGSPPIIMDLALDIVHWASHELESKMLKVSHFSLMGDNEII